MIGDFMIGGMILVAFSSISFAAAFLALLLVMSGRDPRAIAAMTPGARRQARQAQLDEMTRVADAAIEARRLGKRFTRDDAGL